MKPILQFESRWARFAVVVASLVLTRLLFEWVGYQESLDELLSAKALVHLLALIGMSVAIEDSLVRISRSRPYTLVAAWIRSRRALRA